MQENALANTWIVQNCNMNANLKERTWIVQNYIFFFKPEIVVLVRGTAIDLNGPDYIYIGVLLMIMVMVPQLGITNLNS